MKDHHNHDTEWHKEIANNNRIMLARTGSSMYGTQVATSDEDYTGVCIEPPEVALGILPGSDGALLFEQCIDRTAAPNERSTSDDRDITTYGLRKFLRLCAKGDPNMTTLLFAPPLQSSGTWREIQDGRDKLLSKQTGLRFEKYLGKQVAKYLTHDQSPRPELVAEYGWDTKAGYHAMRIAIQATGLMRSGVIALPMNDIDAEYLVSIRKGTYSKDEVMEELKEQVHQLQLATASSPLPDSPDYSLVSAWNAKLYQEYWDYQEECRFWPQ